MGICKNVTALPFSTLLSSLAIAVNCIRPLHAMYYMKHLISVAAHCLTPLLDNLIAIRVRRCYNAFSSFEVWELNWSQGAGGDKCVPSVEKAVKDRQCYTKYEMEQIIAHLQLAALVRLTLSLTLAHTTLTYFTPINCTFWIYRKKLHLLFQVV